MDLVHTYDTVKICVNVHTRHFTFQGPYADGPCAYRKVNLPARISSGKLSEVMEHGEKTL